MGLIRKTLSASTMGGVKYTSRREAQTKAAIGQARVANAEAKLLREQAKAVRRGAAPAPEREMAPQYDGVPGPVVRGPYVPVEGLPAWRQPTIGQALAARRARRG